MTHQLKSRDIIALGFMTFAAGFSLAGLYQPYDPQLYAGPAVAGVHYYRAGERADRASGYLEPCVSNILVQLLTVVALAKVGGGVESLSTPIGKVAGILLAVVCYLAVGPLFATPRTATVSLRSVLRR